MKKAKKQLDLEVDAKRKMEQEARDIKPQPYDYYLICDVEATCQEGSTFDYENEIIEFPVILVDGSSMTEIDVFHAYVKPLIHSELSEFCTRLTGIQQKTVDEAEPFHSVYADFKEWLNTRVNSTSECIFVTDGPWDLRDFIEKEFVYHNYNRPEFMKKIIDLRKMFKSYYEKELEGGLCGMLSSLGMKFEGNEHSGIDDARNILRVFYKMVEDGCRMEFNTDLKKHKAKRGKWFKMRK